METEEPVKTRSRSFYLSVHTLESPVGWMRLEFRPHDRGVDLWITNTVDETQPVTLHLPADTSKYWGFEKPELVLLPDQNGIEGSPNNGFSREFCRWLWSFLQVKCRWTVVGGTER